MLPLVEREITEGRKWLDKEEFLDVVGISQSMPGVMILNVATTVGYKIAGIKGAIWASLGAVVPPFLSIVCVAWFFLKIKDAPLVTRIFSGIRPAVIALIAIPVVNLSKAAKINRATFIVPIIVILLLLILNLNPVEVILAGIAFNVLRIIVMGKRK